MNLSTVFDEAFKHAEGLCKLYNGLSSKNTRAAKSDWIQKVHKNKIIRWPMHDGLWRSFGDSLLILGNKKQSPLSQENFQSDNLVLLLRAALVFAMAAVDKILHDAITKKFTTLVRKGSLDKLLEISISNAYDVATKSQKRRGKGGKRKTRPSHLLMDVVKDDLYRQTFLSNRKLEEICKSCGLANVFSSFGKLMTPRQIKKDVWARWQNIYQKRNHIAHECDIVRKEKAKKIHWNPTTASELLEDIDFIRKFGGFIANKLH